MATMHDPTTIAEQLELFFGAASEGEARIYARLPGIDVASGWRIGGALTGPESRFAHTLQATIAFRQLSGAAARSDALLAEVILPEPCFWTPAAPLLYRARIELRGPEVDAKPAEPIVVERWLGIRPLGTRGRSFVLDGERWVPRGIARRHATAGDLAAAHEAELLLHVAAADDALCLEASRAGVALAVDWPAAAVDPEQELRRLSRWPAVFFVVVDAAERIDFDPRAVARNLLVALCSRGHSMLDAPSWVQALWQELEPGDALASLATVDTRLPRIISRPSATSVDLAAGRAACDRLQYDLADVGDFAGYIV